MRYRMLGQLRAGDGALWSPVAAPRQRALLAILLIEAGRVVSAGRLVDELWGGNPPRRGVDTLQVYVGRLRRLLALSSDELAAVSGGYTLRCDDGDIDARVFEGLVMAGRQAAGEPQEVATSLAKALRLWDGPALADVPASPLVTTFVARLERMRLDALEDRLAADLELGRHAQVVDELSRLVAEHPARERLHAHHMLALYRCERRAEALKAYRDARRTLVDELGLEPGPELRGIELEILSGDWEAAAPERSDARVPLVAQLPPEAAGFTGRIEELLRLDGLLRRQGEPQPVCTIAGAAGVGKTALALRWAHRRRDRFPDGQLYLNLRGYDTGPPVRPLDALSRFLRALGLTPSQIPAEQDEAVAAFRGMLAGKRMLLLLDNANHAEQVRPLLPDGPGCLALVTSRDRLDGLVSRDGTVRIELEALPAEQARALLERLLDPLRGPGLPPQEVAEVARLCGYLPLALRIAAANLLSRPHWTLEDYARRMRRGDRLDALEVTGDPHTGVRAAFDLSYTCLPAESQRLFGLLGLIPGPDTTAAAVAALAQITPARAGRLLDDLCAVHLVTSHIPGRYAMHDLIRHYAAGKAKTQDLLPLYAFCLHHVDAAAQRLYPQVLRVPGHGSTPDGVAFGSDDEALAWLDAERANLVATVVHAAKHNAGMAWRLADAMRGYLYLGEHTADWFEVAKAARAAATTDGEPKARVAAEISLGALDYVRNRYSTAIEHNTRALELARQARWAAAESTALCNLGAAYWALGDARQAATHHAAALALDRDIDRVSGQAANLGNLGPIYAALGRLDLAAEHRTQAVELSRRIGSPRLEGVNLAGLGEVCLARGRMDEAFDAARSALEIFRAAGQSHSEPYPLRIIAVVHRDAGRYAQAMESADTALRLARDHEDRFREAGAHVTIGGIHQRLGRSDLAVESYWRALDLGREVGDLYQQAEAMIGLANALHETREPVQAREHAMRALAIASEHGYRLLECDALEALAAGHSRLGDQDQARQCGGQAEAIRTETGYAAHG